MTLGSGPDEIDLYCFGRGHTGGDAWVVFPTLRLMHAADMFPSMSVPIMDASNGQGRGSLSETALERPWRWRWDPCGAAWTAVSAFTRAGSLG